MSKRASTRSARGTGAQRGSTQEGLGRRGPEHPIERISCASWNEFKGTFTELLSGIGRFERGRYLFRGHGDPSWKLEPAFDRKFRSVPRSRTGEVFNFLFEEFKRGLEAFQIPREARENSSALLALGQHYGLPTRLLDWSESPYIAAFFAYNNVSVWGTYDQHVVIWALDSSNAIWDEQFGVQIIKTPSIGNERLRNQSGKFTLSRTPHGALEDYVESFPDVRGALYRFELPANEAELVLADLDAMQIHHGTVFPEIEGTAQMSLYRTVSRYKYHAIKEG